MAKGMKVLDVDTKVLSLHKIPRKEAHHVHQSCQGRAWAKHLRPSHALIPLNHSTLPNFAATARTASRSTPAAIKSGLRVYTASCKISEPKKM